MADKCANSPRIAACVSYASKRLTILEFELALATRRGEFLTAAPAIMAEIRYLENWIHDMQGSPLIQYKTRHGKDCTCAACNAARFVMPSAKPNGIPSAKPSEAPSLDWHICYPALPQIGVRQTRAIRCAGFNPPLFSNHEKNESLTVSTMQAGDSPCLAWMANTLCYRLENPKAKRNAQGEAPNLTIGKIETIGDAKRKRKLRIACGNAKIIRPLTESEKCDVFQACAQALISLGDWHAEKPSRAAWFAAFKAARALLSRNNTASARTFCFSTLPSAEVETAVESFALAQAASLSPEQSAAIRNQIAEQVIAWRSALLAGLRASQSRKRRAAYHGARRTLQALCNGSLRNRSGLNQSEFRKISDSLRRLWALVDTGKQALADETAQARAQALAHELQSTMACDKRK